MKTYAVVPARYASSRFPGKPLALIFGKPMIQRVYENLQEASDVLDGIYVATDDKRIYDTVTGFGGNAIMTSANHTCGTDRIAECAQILGLDDEDLILNIQGDEPMVNRQLVLDLKSCMDDPHAVMGTLKKKLTDPSKFDDPNVVKVVTDVNDDAIYFSRFCIPHTKNPESTEFFVHVGAYCFKKKFLMEYSKMAKTPLEKAESLEQLRVLENGYKIKVKETNCEILGVNTPEDLEELLKVIEK